MKEQSWVYRVLTLNGWDPSGLLPFGRRSWLYYTGVGLMAGKVLATVLQFAHLSAGLDAAYGHAFRIAWYDVGKATPTLFCVAFLLDAAIYRKDRRATVFWSWFTGDRAGADDHGPRAGRHGYGWNLLDLFRR